MILRSAGLILAITTLAFLAWGCGGGGGLLNDDTTPTPSGTPPIFQRSPVVPTTSPVATGTPTRSPGAGTTPTGQTPTANIAVTPVTAFEITVTEAVNIRETPSTDGAIKGGIFPGEKKRVIGQALGQEVDAGSGNRIWYQLEEGGFVFSGLVQKVE